VNEILDRHGNPTTVLCVAPTGLERVCRTTEDLEQFLSAYPSCHMWFGNKEEQE
jgi:hypothetical protein